MHHRALIIEHQCMESASRKRAHRSASRREMSNQALRAVTQCACTCIHEPSPNRTLFANENLQERTCTLRVACCVLRALNTQLNTFHELLLKDSRVGHGRAHSYACLFMRGETPLRNTRTLYYNAQLIHRIDSL